MKERTKKLISMMLIFVMTVALTACGGKKESEETNSGEVNDKENASEGVAYDDEEIYMNALGDFYGIYEEALEAENVSERYALMAAAEAKFLESGVAFPLYTSGASYLMSRLAYRTGGFSLWSGECGDYTRMYITNEIIKKEDYEHLKELWQELVGTGTYTETVKTYLQDQGYTFKDSYNNVFDELGKTWDIHAATGSLDSKFIAPTCEGLYSYDDEGTLLPQLAESYEVSDDELTYTFKIREGVIWSDSQGRKVADLVADDWVAAAQHIADALSSDTEDFSDRIVGYTEYMNGETTDFSTVGIKAPDDHTLEFTLIEPCPYFMSIVRNFIPMSRSYYTSQGGVFGIAEYEETSVSGSYNYGIDQDHIAYCGPYLCTNVTDKNSVTYSANPDYWNYDNMTVKTINWTYDDASDVTRTYTNFVNGVTTSFPLKTAHIETAKADGNFDKYVTISDTGTNTFLLWCNLHRETYANVADGAAASTKTDEQKEVTFAALQNQHFRLALSHSIDRATYNSQALGEDLKYVCLRNSFVPATFVMLEEDTTIEVNGKSADYKAGTYYGEIVQAQLDADGYDVKVWDDEAKSGDGFDGWYDPDKAAEELKLAVEDLKKAGIEVTKENPIIIDYPHVAYNENGNNQAYVLKTSIESALDGLVVFNLIGCNDAEEVRNVDFNTQNGSEHNCDVGGMGGLGADYGDPECYLNAIKPYGDGYATPKMGLW